MDSFNSFSSFNSPSFNVNSWGSVTNNLGQSFGSVDRYGSFQSNLNPSYSFNVDRFGSISNGYNGIGTQIGRTNNYDSYQRTNNLRTSMDYLNKKDSDDYYFGRTRKSYKPELTLPKMDPIIPNILDDFSKKYRKSYDPEFTLPKIDPIVSYKDPKIYFNSPASVPLFPYTSYKKKSSFGDDFGFKLKL